ncbi:MAG: hypothetical protein C0397_19510 [Odoribacter sp.]|nr:hypothetical protein [Odoribacter sp.]
MLAHSERRKKINWRGKKMKKAIILSIAIFVFTTNFVSADTFGTGENQFTIDFVPISGDASSANGTNIGNWNLKGFIDPSNNYRMGKFEITNNQWTKFKDAYGAVTGTPSTAYDENPYFTGTNVPTNELSWYEAAQFVNYLNTSTGHQVAYKFTGTIHTSDYTLAVWDAGDTDGTNFYRNKAAKYFLPTEDEWVKAAYWNGTSLQTYANASSSDLISGVPDLTKWNYNGSQPWAVGSGAQELNGTYDMMGNAFEWMESPFFSDDYLSGSNHCIRGGSSYNTANNLASYSRDANYPFDEYEVLGFRVASVIPEPCTLLLLGLGGLLIRKR